MTAGLLALTLLALAHSRLLAGPLSLALALSRLLAFLTLLLPLAALALLLASLSRSALSVLAFPFPAAAGGLLESPAHVFETGKGALEALIFAASACSSESFGFTQLISQAIDRFGHRAFALRDERGKP